MSDKAFVLTDCPECGTEHRIHKLRAACSMIKCTNCGALFIVMKQSAEEAAFMKAFGGGRRGLKEMVKRNYVQ